MSQVGRAPKIEPPDAAEPPEGFSARVLGPGLRRMLAMLARVTPAGNMEKLQDDLLLAGQPANLSLLDFLGIKLLSALVVAVGTFALLVARRMSGPPAMLFSLIGGVVGLYVPNIWLRRRKQQRQKAIQRALPDALDMLCICVDAGLGFDAALMRVALRWHNELTEQFRHVVLEMGMGVRRSDALRHMVQRTGVPEVATFIAVLVQADRLGVGITNVLHTQSDAARVKRRLRAEEAARKAPIKMLLPLVFFIFPAMFVVILGPAVPRFMTYFAGF